MTLFIKTPKRLLEIDDAYVMALTFLIFFAVGRIVKSVLERRIHNRTRKEGVQVPNTRGGSFITDGNFITDDTEVAETILACIADNERYLVKDPKVIKLIFKLVKAKINQESLVMSPNLIRFLALKLKNPNQTFLIKMGNLITSSDNQLRLLVRVIFAGTIGVCASFFGSIQFIVFILAVSYNLTEDCGYKCSNYFEQLPKDEPIKILADQSTGHLLIKENDDVGQPEIYLPSTAKNEVTVSSDGGLATTTNYRKTSKKAKQVKFSDFRKTDPVLSSFKNLKEPEVPKKICALNNDDMI